MTVSFVMGTILFGRADPPKNLPGAIMAIVVLLVGVGLIAICGTQSTRRFLRRFPLFRRCVDPSVTEELMVAKEHEDDPPDSLFQHRPAVVLPESRFAPEKPVGSS